MLICNHWGKWSLKKIQAAFIIFALAGFFFSSPLYAQDFQRDPRIAAIKPAKPVRIVLKRDNKGGYTWELSGNDVNEIIKTDRALRNNLRGPSAPAPKK
jgi:hypothetical protein